MKPCISFLYSTVLHLPICCLLSLFSIYLYLSLDTVAPIYIWNVWHHTCEYMHVRMYVRMYVCMYVCMYACGRTYSRMEGCPHTTPLLHLCRTSQSSTGLGNIVRYHLEQSRCVHLKTHRRIHRRIPIVSNSPSIHTPIHYISVIQSQLSTYIHDVIL